MYLSDFLKSANSFGLGNTPIGSYETSSNVMLTAGSSFFKPVGSSVARASYPLLSAAYLTPVITYSATSETVPANANTTVASSQYDCAYGNGVFVAVGSTSGGAAVVQTSSDGITWHDVPVSFAHPYFNIIFANGQFIITPGGSYTDFRTSVDGITWSAPQVINSGFNIQQMAYGAGLYVAMTSAATTTYYTSPDLVTWTAGVLPSALAKARLKFYGTKFLILFSPSSTFNSILYSSDGLTWYSATLPATTYWGNIQYNGSLYWVDDSNYNHVATSPDGVTWTAGVMAANGSISYVGIPGYFCALFNNSAGVYTFYYSPTGASGSWANIAVSGPTIGNLFYGNGVLTSGPSTAAAGIFQFYIPSLTSLTLTSGPTTSSFLSGTYGNGLFCLFDWGNSAAATSPDGVTWTARTLPIGAGWQSSAYGAGLYVVISNHIYLTSPDGVTWTQRALPSAGDWRSIIYANGQFVIVQYGSSEALTSPDGITWTVRTLPSVQNWISVTYGNGVYVAVAKNSNVVATSPDGITWTSHTMPSSTDWVSVAFGSDVNALPAGLFVAVAATGRVMATSTDGSTWTQTTVAYNTTTVVYSNGMFMVLDGAGNVYLSFDGVTWTTEALTQIETVLTPGAGMTVATERGSTTSNNVWIVNPDYVYLSGTSGQYVRVA
jgi:hypothetical protein